MSIPSVLVAPSPSLLYDGLTIISFFLVLQSVERDRLFLAWRQRPCRVSHIGPRPDGCRSAAAVTAGCRVESTLARFGKPR